MVLSVGPTDGLNRFWDRDYKRVLLLPPSQFAFALVLSFLDWETRNLQRSAACSEPKSCQTGAIDMKFEIQACEVSIEP